jgi:hypothetical protein
MENNKLPVKAFNQRRPRYKAKGRPRVRWIDNIKDILKKHGYSIAMATYLALESKLKLKPLRFTVGVDRTYILHPGQDNRQYFFYG